MALIKKIRITKNDAMGVIPVNPVVFEVCAEAFSLKATPKTADIECLTSIAAVKTITGEDFGGGVTMNYTLQNAGLIVPMILGAATSTVDFTAATWAANTAYAVGDIVNHSDGIHSMVVTYIKGDGSTGATEPTVVAGNGASPAQDNNVRWSIVPKFVKSIGTLSSAPVLFSVEYELDDGTGTPFFKRFNGVEASKLPISIKGDGGIPKIESDLSPMKAEDSEQVGWTKDLATMVGVKIVQMGKDYYSGNSDDQDIFIDGVKGCVYEANIDIDKGFTTKETTCGKRTTRKTTVAGKSSIDFTRDQYNAYKVQTESAYKFVFKSGTGGYTQIEYPKVQPLPTDPDLTGIDEVMLAPEIYALEDSIGTLVKYEVVYPQFLDTAGTPVTF